MVGDRGWWQSTRLGAPAERVGWCHGSAGRIDEGGRVDCWLRVDSGAVSEARFEVFGGPEAMRCAAWLADWLAGRPIPAVQTVTGRWIAESTALSDEARSAALDIEDALRSALAVSDERRDGADNEH